MIQRRLEILSLPGIGPEPLIQCFYMQVMSLYL